MLFFVLFSMLGTNAGAGSLKMKGRIGCSILKKNKKN